MVVGFLGLFDHGDLRSPLGLGEKIAEDAMVVVSVERWIRDGNEVEDDDGWMDE